MAHGFLSYQDSRGKSGIEKALENLVEKKYKELKEHLLKERKKTDQKIEEVSVKVEGPAALRAGQQPLLSGGNQKAVAAAPLQKMLGGTALQKSIAAGPSAVNPDVYGGGLSRGGFNGRPLKSEGFVSDRIVNVGSTDLGVDRDFDGDDMFVKRMAPVGGGDSGEVVQAIDRLTMVTMGLVAATKQQTQVQQQIAQTQQLEAEKLGRKSLAASEEFSLERGGDLSSNAAYMGLGANGMALMGAGGGRGGGPGMGIGGKVMTKNILKAATKRGAARTGTRLGAALGGRMLGGLGARMGAKLGSKGIGKLAGGALAKSLGKKIPLVGLGLGAVFAAQRAMQGDFLGAGLELASGAASTVPGIGTAGSVGIDAALLARDMTMPSGADGMVTTGPKSGYLAELHGTEVTLSGNKSKEMKDISLNIGEGILDAQKRNKRLFGQLQSEGLHQYYDKQGGWDGFYRGLKEILGALTLPGIGKIFRFKEDKEEEDTTTSGGGGDDTNNVGGGGTAEQNLAAFLSTMEASGNQNQADAFQVMLNRTADAQAGGSFKAYGTSLGSQIMGREQFSPLSAAIYGASEDSDAAAKYGPITKALGSNPAERKKKLLEISSQPDGLNALQKLFGGGSASDALKVLQDFKSGGSLSQTSASDIGSMVSFRGYEPEGGYDFNRGAGGNFFFNKGSKTGSLSNVSPGDAPKTSASNGADWAKSLNLGNEPFIDFGDNNQFRAIKKDSGGYRIMKKGFLGMFTPIDTEGKNLGLKEQLIEAAKPKEVSSLNPTTDNDSTSLTASVDDPNALNTASTDAQLTASAGAGTTIINNYNTTTGGGKSSGGDDVSLASNFSQMGPNPIFAAMALRA